MNGKVQKKVVVAIILLSIIGFITSMYLVQNHYSAKDNAICDFSATISCSAVSASQFSELFRVPVAIFGALWFVVLIALSWHVMKKDDSVLIGIPAWNVLGILFVIYFIVAEVLLKSLCPFCTLVHIIIIITFILSVFLYHKQETKPDRSDLKKKLRPWLIGIIILNLIPLILFNVLMYEDTAHEDFAQCLTDEGVTLYSSEFCSVCKRQKDLFGESYRNLNVIECSPQGENAQPELCQDKKIKATPTWMVEKDGEVVKKQIGFMTVEELRAFSGCHKNE